MQWDLIEEHNGTYDEEVCKKINELIDLFDIILDDMKLYPSMMCVDVFPCIENIDTEIPIYIQKYYEVFLDEEYRTQMQKRFDFRLNLKKIATGSIYKELQNIFGGEFLSKQCVSIPENHHENIKKVADRLSEELGTTVAESFFVSKEDLYVLREVYIGILFSGWVLRCGDYGILILLGTNE